MSIMQYDLGVGEDKNWLVAESSFDSRYLGKGESLFCQGNGYMGQRAALEEEYVGQTRGLFVNGTFHCFDESEVTELPNLPDMTNIRFAVNGVRFSLDTGRVISSRRYLHLKTGELNRTVEWESPAGDRLRFDFRRFVSLHNEHLTGAKVEVTPVSGPVALKVESGINGRMTNTGSQHFCEGEKRIYGNTILEMMVKAQGSDVSCCLHAGHRLLLDGQSFTPAVMPIIDRRYLGLKCDVTLEQNQTLTLEKICCVHTSRDQAYDVDAVMAAPLMKEAGKSLVTDGLREGYEALFDKSRQAWEDFWHESDISVDSSREYDQLALRFALYHLNIMVNQNDSRVGIGAKALTGEGYKGHSFWDTEIFLLPYYTLTRPDTAKTLLTYRYKGLLGARRKAKENGYQGAMYPWEAAWIDDGEVTPLWGAADVVTGLPLPILTGILEQHITADVAYAVWQYYTSTGDQDFMDRCGYEILLETAIFWASRVTWDEKKNAFVILDVIGPDEYKEHVDNNAYTNYMAHFNMRLALSIMDELEERGGEVYGRLSGRISFDVNRAVIKKAADLIYLPKTDEKSEIIPQIDGYFDLEPLDLDKYKKSSVVGTIYHDYNMDKIGKMQVSKQADLLVLMLLLSEQFSMDIKEKNFVYYEERTLHDSSLSKSTHCVLACDLGKTDIARHFFHGACDIDLGPVMTTSDMGIHSASMGGIWQCAVYGFGGVRILNGMLHVAPRLPEDWEKLSFPLCYKGQKLFVTADLKGVTVINRGSKEVDIMLYGRTHTLRPGQEVRIENEL